MLGRF